MIFFKIYLSDNLKIKNNWNIALNKNSIISKQFNICKKNLKKKSCKLIKIII